MWSDHLCLYHRIHAFSWIQWSWNELVITEGRGSSLWRLSRPRWQSVLSFWQFAMPPTWWGCRIWRSCCFSLIAIQYAINSFSPGSRWYSGSTLMMGLDYPLHNVECFCSYILCLFCRIKNGLFGSMDMDIILVPHIFSQQANIDHRCALHGLQSLYYLCQLVPKTFLCDHDKITEYKMTDTMNLSMAFIVIHRLYNDFSLGWVFSQDHFIGTPSSSY